jgi:hypothetical protein
MEDTNVKKLIDTCEKFLQYRKNNTLSFQLEKADDFFREIEEIVRPMKYCGMKDSDVKIGMKVVPFQKTVVEWGDLEDSSCWMRRVDKPHPFLYVNEWDKDINCWILGDINVLGAGDYFNACDFEPYSE